MGLSEISAAPGGYIVIERDDLSGDFAQLKTLVDLHGRALADGRLTRDEKRRYDSGRDSSGWAASAREA